MVKRNYNSKKKVKKIKRVSAKLTNIEIKDRPHLKSEFINKEVDYILKNNIDEYDKDIYYNHLETFFNNNPATTWRYKKNIIDDVYNEIEEKASKIIEEKDIIENKRRKFKDINNELDSLISKFNKIEDTLMKNKKLSIFFSTTKPNKKDLEYFFNSKKIEDIYDKLYKSEIILENPRHEIKNEDIILFKKYHKIYNDILDNINKEFEYDKNLIIESIENLEDIINTSIDIDFLRHNKRLNEYDELIKMSKSLSIKLGQILHDIDNEKEKIFIKYDLPEKITDYYLESLEKQQKKEQGKIKKENIKISKEAEEILNKEFPQKISKKGKKEVKNIEDLTIKEIDRRITALKNFKKPSLQKDIDKLILRKAQLTKQEKEINIIKKEISDETLNNIIDEIIDNEIKDVSVETINTELEEQAPIFTEEEKDTNEYLLNEIEKIKIELEKYKTNKARNTPAVKNKILKLQEKLLKLEDDLNVIKEEANIRTFEKIYENVKEHSKYEPESEYETEEEYEEEPEINQPIQEPKINEPIEGTGIKEAFKRVKNIFTNTGSVSTDKAFKTYGQMNVISFSVHRTPVEKAIKGALNAISLGKFNEYKNKYDDLYHLYIILQLIDNSGKYHYVLTEKRPQIEWEKRQNLLSPVSKDMHIEKSFNPVNFTLMLQHAINEGGGLSNYFKYTAEKQNCQQWVISIINSLYKINNMPTPSDVKDFVLQDVNNLITGHTKSISKGITDIGSFFGRVKQAITGGKLLTKQDIMKLNKMHWKNNKNVFQLMQGGKLKYVIDMIDECNCHKF